MIAEFEELSPTPDREGQDRKAVALDESIRAQLESLGYATPSPPKSVDVHNENEGEMK